MRNKEKHQRECEEYLEHIFQYLSKNKADDDHFISIGVSMLAHAINTRLYATGMDISVHVFEVLSRGILSQRDDTKREAELREVAKATAQRDKKTKLN